MLTWVLWQMFAAFSWGEMRWLGVELLQGKFALQTVQEMQSGDRKELGLQPHDLSLWLSILLCLRGEVELSPLWRAWWRGKTDRGRRLKLGSMPVLRMSGWMLWMLLMLLRMGVLRVLCMLWRMLWRQMLWVGLRHLRRDLCFYSQAANKAFSQYFTHRVDDFHSALSQHRGHCSLGSIVHNNRHFWIFTHDHSLNVVPYDPVGYYPVSFHHDRRHRDGFPIALLLSSSWTMEFVLRNAVLGPRNHLEYLTPWYFYT